MKNPNNDEIKTEEELTALENAEVYDCFLVYSGQKTWAEIFTERERKQNEENTDCEF